MHNKIFTGIVFSIFFGSTVMDLLQDSVTSTKQIPETKIGMIPATQTPHIDVAYCQSCGYAKAFSEYKDLLNQKYPDFTITGRYYHPTGIYGLLAKTAMVVKLAGILAIATNRNIFGMVGARQPQWWCWCLNNKIYSCISLYFISNMFESMLLSTGAFEITLNGNLIWSKIESGRIPQPQELFSIIDSQIPADSLNFDPPVFPK